jgi:pimeloyl-ACP methyl ester carboxylesterase
VSVAEPDEAGTHDGLAYALYRGEPGAGGVVILHGAASSKESHLDFARACQAHGLSAIAFDQRGHGATGGQLDGRMVSDVATIAALLPDGEAIGLRGSSMGGWLALAAAESVDALAVVAICPASAEGMVRAVRSGQFELDMDVDGVVAAIEAHDADAGAAALDERLLLLHAEGDEVVPVERSQALHDAAPGSRLVAVPGGHHRSVQHDPELQALTLRFLAKRLSRRA